MCEPLEFGSSHFLNQRGALLRGNLKGAWEPARKGTVQKGIADKKHKKNREQGNSHRADDHFRFETRTELLTAALGPKPERGAKDNERKNNEECGDEGRNRIKS